MNIVLDTNVLVSALWSPGKNASEILSAVFSQKLTACYDFRILDEYNRVLHYTRFPFAEWEINAILEPIEKMGISVVADPLPEVAFTDESDRKFYEVAKFCSAVLITGNQRHYPDDPDVITMGDFRTRYL